MIDTQDIAITHSPTHSLLALFKRDASNPDEARDCGGEGRFTGYKAARNMIMIIANMNKAMDDEYIQVRPSTASTHKAAR